MFSHSLLFLYCTVPFSTSHTAHATVIRLNHECIQYTAETETETMFYIFTVTTLPLPSCNGKDGEILLNSSTNISIHALQLHVCIANVHLNSLDNIYCTFEKLFFYALSLPLPAVSAGMAHIHPSTRKYCLVSKQ